MTISMDRIKMEIEKIFLCSPPLAYAALKHLEGIEGLPKANKHFSYYQERAKGDMAFLWAGYIKGDVPFYSERNMKILNLPKDMEKEIVYYLRKTANDDFLHPLAERNLEFDLAFSLSNLAKRREAFGPFSSAKEKLKSIGINGDVVYTYGFRGTEIGEILDVFSEYILEYPDTPAARFRESLTTRQQRRNNNPV